MGHFTFWISLSLRLSPSRKFELKLISQKVKSFFLVWSQRLAERIAETKLRTERSLNTKLINSPVDFTCTRLVNRLEIKFWWAKITSLFRLFINKQRNTRYRRWRQWWHDGVSSDVRRAWLVNLNSGLRLKLSSLVSVFGLSERLIQKVKWPNEKMRWRPLTSDNISYEALPPDVKESGQVIVEY